MAKGLWTIAQNLGLNERANQATLSEQGFCVTSTNTSWMTDGVLCLRRGTTSQTLTSSGFTGDIKWIGRHVTNTGTEERWAAANNAGTAALARQALAGAWGAVTYSDTVTVANLLYHHSATVDGKFFLAYDSDVNRLHVWDGTNLRRVGVTKPAALTVADTGAGAYAATARRYRTSQRIYDASLNILAESELSDAVAFTPSGAGTAARVTKSTTIDSATHWVVWGLISTAGDTYDLYVALSVLAVGTTTYDDSTNPSAYTGDFPQELGVNIPPPSAKFLTTDGGRVILANGWETSGSAGQTTPKPNRVWFTRVLGTSDQGDLESIPNSLTRDYHLDIGDAGPITGLLGPLYGDIYVFKRTSIWKMIPTGDVTTPYRAIIVSETAGALDQRLITAIGKVGAMFADETNIRYLAADSEPQIVSDPIEVSLTYGLIFDTTGWLAYDQWSGHVFIFLTATSTGYWYDIRRPRWGALAWATALVMNRGVMTFNSDGRQRLIMVGKTAAAASLMLSTGDVNSTDALTTFTGTVTYRRVPSPGHLLKLLPPTIWYRCTDSNSTTSVIVTYIRPDLTTSTRTVTLTVAPILGSFTVDGVYVSDVMYADVKLELTHGNTGDATAPASIELVVIPYEESPVVAQ